MAAIHIGNVDKSLWAAVIREMVLAVIGRPITNHTFEVRQGEGNRLADGWPAMLVAVPERIHRVEGIGWEFRVDVEQLRHVRLTGLQSLALAALTGEPCGPLLVDELLAASGIDVNEELLAKVRADERKRCEKAIRAAWERMGESRFHTRDGEIAGRRAGLAEAERIVREIE